MVAAVALPLAPTAAADEITYTRLPDTDTGQVPNMFLERVGTPDLCGAYYHLPPCNITDLERQCRAACGCAGFNSDGWLKGCVSASCGAAQQHHPGVDTYVGSAVSTVSLPDLDPIDDIHYPAEEPAETANLTHLQVVSLSADAAVLRDPSTNETATAAVDAVVFGVWRLNAILQPSPRTNITSPMAVVERRFSRWGLVAFLAPASSTPVLILRSGGGDVRATRQRRLDPAAYNQYMGCAATSATDLLSGYLHNRSAHEPTYGLYAAYMAPVHDYAIIGTVDASYKFSVAPDGRVKNADSNIYTPMLNASEPGPGVLVFDPRAVLDYWPADNFTDLKSSLLGRFVRAIHINAWDTRASRGHDQLVFAATNSAGDVFVRLANVEAATAAPAYAYTYYIANRSNPLHPAPTTPDVFYAALYTHAQPWHTLFSDTPTAMQARLPGPEGQRLLDMSRGMLVSAMTAFVGLHPNYGDGRNYWSVDQKDRGSLPLTSLALDSGLLQWGLLQPAADRVAYYFQTFVDPDGAINLQHWRDQCEFADGWSDYGRMLDLFATTATLLNNATWTQAVLPRALNMTQYTLNLVANASSKTTPPGLIVGPAEHDVCTDLRPWFSVNFWTWRGLVVMQRFLAASAPSALLASINATLAAFTPVVQEAVRVSLVNSSAAGQPFFLPPASGPGQTPFTSMVADTVSSYSNFRFFSEMLSSEFLTPDVANVLADFRESHQGTFSGMTRFRTWLDDMPAVGYARSNLVLSRRDAFQAILWGHAANYVSPGTFQASEQLGYKGSGRFREYLNYEPDNEVDIDLCVPSSMLLSRSLAYALVLEERDKDWVWIARGAPQRWFAGDGGIAVTQAPTRFGPLNFTAAASSPTAATVRVQVPVAARLLSGSPGAPLLALHIRSASVSARLASTTVTNGDLHSIDSTLNVAYVAPTVPAGTPPGSHITVTVTATFVEDAATVPTAASPRSKPVAVAFASSRLSGPLTVYVSPTGSDTTGTGTLASPLKTLAGAVAHVRAHRPSPPTASTPATIMLRGGVYPQTSVALGPADSFLTITAYGGEEVLLSGGTPIPASAFSPAPAIGPKVVQVHLPSLNITDYGTLITGDLKSCQNNKTELFYNGQPMWLARWPNIPNNNGSWGWAHVDKPTADGFQWTTDENVPAANWVHEEDPWLHGYWSFDWSDELVQIAGINVSNREILMGTGKTTTKTGGRWLALNVLAELDQPGEYYISRSNGTLYFLPPGAAETASYPPTRRAGAAAFPGTFLSTTQHIVTMAAGTTNVTIANLALMHSRSTAIVAEQSTNIVARQLVVANTGGNATVFSNCTTSRVDSCTVYGVACMGISLTGGDRVTLTPASNVAFNNTVSHYARWKRTYQPGLFWAGVGNTYEANSISYAPHNGILGGGNEADLMGANDCVFRNNHLSYLNFETCDSGGFYTCGQDAQAFVNRGNVFTGNVLEEIRMVDATRLGSPSVQALYLDDQMSGWTITNNTFRKCFVAILLGGGRDNIITGNYFDTMDNAAAVHFDNRGMNWQKSSCTPPDGADYVEGMHYAALPAWKKYNVTLDHMCVPVRNVISNNEYCNIKGFIDASPSDISSWMSTAENNVEKCRS